MDNKKVKTICSLHKCPICDSKERTLIYETRDRHYGIKGLWNISKCSKCGLVQLDPMLNSEQLINLYPKTFYAYDQNRHIKKNREIIKKILFPTLLVKDPQFKIPGAVLDYGCGTGWSLLKFRDAGWKCVGIDPSEDATKIGTEQLSLDIKHGTIHTISPIKDNTFDYIRANHSLEHDPDVSETLRKMRKIIKEDGKLLIGVPNINSAPARFFRKYWWYLGAPVHTYSFSPDDLKKILRKNNFEIISIRYCGNFTGILGSIQIYLNRNDPKLLSQDGFVFKFPVFMVIAQFTALICNFFKSGDAIEVIAKPI